MSRIVPVIKREFTETVGSKAFVIGTVLGPVLIFALFFLQFLIMAKGGGGEHRVTILDATGRGVGERVVQELTKPSNLPSFVKRATFDLTTQPVTTDQKDAVTKQNSQRIVDGEQEGYLWIPEDVLSRGALQYEGSNATNSQVTNGLQRAAQRVVQSERLRAEGIDEERLSSALTPVEIDVRKTGDDGAVGSPMAALLLAFAMAFAIYMMVILYGQSIMSSVQEEKRDRIVELIVSSVRARDLLVGKVLGIGAAGVLQLLIWVSAAALLLTQGALIASAVGAGPEAVEAISSGGVLPQVSPIVGIAFVLYFAGGFLLFATLFAVIGAIVTNAQEAQQFVMPVLMPFVLGLIIAMTGAENPNGPMAVAGSLIPFTSPMVMPVRVSVGGVSMPELLLSIVLLYATAAAIIWLAAKIYRIAIFATGQKPTAVEIFRWMRAA